MSPSPRAAPRASPERRHDRRQNIKRNNKFLVSVGLVKPPLDAARDDEHEWWYATGH